MKKIVSIIALVATFSVSASAQSLLGDLVGNLLKESDATVASKLAGTVYSAPISLNGTYNYNGAAVSVTSSEGGVIANLAGSAVTSGLEAKVDEYLAKVGVAPGAMKFNFNNEDYSFTMSVAGLAIPGNYKVGDGEKTVTLTFGKQLQYLSMTGTLESTLDGAKMLFPANGAMNFIKKLTNLLGQSSSQVKAISSLADGYDNYKIGFKLSK